MWLQMKNKNGEGYRVSYSRRMFATTTDHAALELGRLLLFVISFHYGFVHGAKGTCQRSKPIPFHTCCCFLREARLRWRTVQTRKKDCVDICLSPIKVYGSVSIVPSLKIRSRILWYSRHPFLQLSIISGLLYQSHHSSPAYRKNVLCQDGVFVFYVHNIVMATNKLIDEMNTNLFMKRNSGWLFFYNAKPWCSLFPAWRIFYLASPT